MPPAIQASRDVARRQILDDELQGLLARERRLSEAARATRVSTASGEARGAELFRVQEDLKALRAEMARLPP